MCKPLSDIEKELLDTMNKVEPGFMLVMFGEALMNGDCQVMSHIATNYLKSFPEDLQPKVTMIGKIVDLVEGSKDEKDETKLAAIDDEIAKILDEESKARPMGPLLEKYRMGAAAAQGVRTRKAFGDLLSAAG